MVGVTGIEPADTRPPDESPTLSVYSEMEPEGPVRHQHLDVHGAFVLTRFTAVTLRLRIVVNVLAIGARMTGLPLATALTQPTLTQNLERLVLLFHDETSSEVSA